MYFFFDTPSVTETDSLSRMSHYGIQRASNHRTEAKQKQKNIIKKEHKIYFEFLKIQVRNLNTLVNIAYFPATPHCPLTPKLTSPSSVYRSFLLSQKTNGDPLSPLHTLCLLSSYPAQNILLVITRFCCLYASIHWVSLTTGRLANIITSGLTSSSVRPQPPTYGETNDAYYNSHVGIFFTLYIQNVQ